VKYREGSPPSLVLVSGDGDEEDQVRMDSWKIEDILEFFQNTFNKG